MLLGDLSNLIGGKIGMSDAATLTKLKAWAKERYDSMWAGALWKDALSIYTKAVTADQHTVILPSHISQFVAAKFDSTGLIPVDQAFLFASNPGLWEDSGTPSHCSELAAIATKAMPAVAGELLRFVSSQGLDIANQVMVHGEDVNGEPLNETVALNGTTPVNTTGSYAVVYGISKGITGGTVTVTGATSLATLLVLKAGEKQRAHRRLRLHTIPSTALTLLILAKRHAGPFTADNDATGLPTQCDQALQAMVHGDALEWMRQYNKAQGKFAEGIALLEQAKATEVYQAAQNKRFTPGESMAEGCSPYDFL